MTTSVTSVLKRFRGTTWKYQQTFITPLKNLDIFVGEIVTALQPCQSGLLAVDQFVFGPAQFNELIAKHGIAAEQVRGWTLNVEGQAEFHSALQAAFSDWVDFVFMPEPAPLAIYADHDEYTTFFAHALSGLNRISYALKERGFRAVPEYERRLR